MNETMSAEGAGISSALQEFWAFKTMKRKV